MPKRSLLLALSLRLSACAGAAAPFGLAATPSLSARERVEAQLRKESGTGASSPAAAAVPGPVVPGAPASVAGGPQQLPNTATRGDALDPADEVSPPPDATGILVWDGGDH